MVLQYLATPAISNILTVNRQKAMHNFNCQPPKATPLWDPLDLQDLTC